MSKTDNELHNECMTRFIDLANELTKAGTSKYVVAGGLMTASCVYSTFMAAGNKGSLSPEDIDRIAGGYRDQLESVQIDRQEKQRLLEEQQLDETVDRLISFPDQD